MLSNQISLPGEVEKKKKKINNNNKRNTPKMKKENRGLQVNEVFKMRK